jgi:hypothetical protein
MGCSASRAEYAGREASLAIDAMLRESLAWEKSRSRPLRALVLADGCSGWSELITRMRRAHAASCWLVDGARERALALACVVRFGFGCPKTWGDVVSDGAEGVRVRLASAAL